MNEEQSETYPDPGIYDSDGEPWTGRSLGWVMIAFVIVVVLVAIASCVLTGTGGL